jgi:hypothetical protein
MAAPEADTWQSFLAFLGVIWPNKKVTRGTVRGDTWHLLEGQPNLADSSKSGGSTKSGGDPLNLAESR